jgi:hypothetical protein
MSKTNREIAEEAWNNTKAPHQPLFKDFTNRDFQVELIGEVDHCVDGRPDLRGLPYHTEVARLVRERNLEPVVFSRFDADIHAVPQSEHPQGISPLSVRPIADGIPQTLPPQPLHTTEIAASKKARDTNAKAKLAADIAEKSETKEGK